MHFQANIVIYYNIYQKIGGYPAVVVSYAENKDLEKCYEIIKKLMDIFANESKRYFWGNSKTSCSFE